MCVITGVYARRAEQPVSAGQLERMTAALSHRGPDGDGFHIEPGIGLGHRRLAIVDPAGGQQPMYNENGAVALVFNGMIYNFQALRRELQAAGHVFTSQCDTETIVHAWEEWGVDCLQRLSGMFALALWDRTRRRLFLARDRLGKKPLYYATADDGSFVFASELAALAGTPGLDEALVAWGLTLPPALKLRAGQGKQILREAMAPALPSEILTRRKQGFATSRVPVRHGSAEAASRWRSVGRERVVQSANSDAFAR
jgi:asparagine synthetase B (glutamine-hydrolysing)